MGMQTVAEGVENEEVLAALALIGVDFAQGFHIQRPMPLEQIKLTALPHTPRPLATPTLKAVVVPGGTR
jgi:EAL domain-containing protein (putative c-di-GMP-specific phosphodiesterase class I)